ncbi:MAG TPA: TetR/AcrR family transcriptional regulator [Thermodesulfobacteriota bacterium]|nr:TetR/AcrR family transcriptional regulator [Thermodesulfobacteriota bacterium]
MNVKDTKTEILDLAEDLLLDKGFNAFSYAHISSALKIKNAAIHYHFPTKGELGAAVILRARDRFSKWTRDERMLSKSPDEKLEAFFRSYLRFLDAGQRVCLGGALETDFKTLPSNMQGETRKFVSAIVLWVGQVLKEGKETGVFSFPGKAGDQALVILSTLQGALQMTRAVGPSCLHSAMDQVRRLTGKR